MAKKVSPILVRLGITRDSESRWFADLRTFKDKWLQDIQLRKFLTIEFKDAGVSKIEILRHAKNTKVIVHCSKPGVVIGRSGENIQVLIKKLRGQFGEAFDVQVQEIRKPEIDSKLVAEKISEELSKRLPFRRVAKQALEKAMESGAKGIKIQIAGRLNGADIARAEKLALGTVPLQTLRADVDYAKARCETTFGSLGIKVWIYHGLVFKKEKVAK